MLTAALHAIGERPEKFGGHSFRIGGSQALAAAGKSVLYIMSYGRWTCPKSVLRYVTAPEFIRALDAKHMATAVVDVPWADVQTAIDGYYSSQRDADKLWVAPSMLAQGAPRVTPRA